MNIVISEFMDLSAVQNLKNKYNVIYDKDLVNKKELLINNLQKCNALIVRNKTQVRGEILDAAPNLRVVGRLGVGLDNIDLAACKERNIQVIPALGANNISVAEYVLAGMLMLARGCYLSSSAVAQGKWPRECSVGGEVFNKTLGLLGFGGIARDVALRAKIFGMNIIAHDPFLSSSDQIWKKYEVIPVSLDEMLNKADFVSLHVPLTNDTLNMINEDKISLMKHGAYLINTSRGGIVDEGALAHALISGSVGGAMIDVFAKEPLPANTPLGAAPNCIMTPHIAGVTKESNTRVSSLIANKVDEALQNLF